MSKTKWQLLAAAAAILMIIHIATANIPGLVVGAPGLMIALYFYITDDNDDYPDCLGV